MTVDDNRQEAAKRLGLRACTTCKRVAPLEEICLEDEEGRGQVFYLGGFYCASCAASLREKRAECKSLVDVKKLFDMTGSVRLLSTGPIRFGNFGSGGRITKGSKS